MKNIAQQILHLLIYMVLLIPTMLLAQPICQIQHFSIYNGLVQRTVSDIVQDSKGFIWFSTWNGLNRYDGYTFKNYKAYPGDGCTLTSNRILRIVPDQQNNICVRLMTPGFIYSKVIRKNSSIFSNLLNKKVEKLI